MLGQCLRRRPSTEPKSGQCFAFAGLVTVCKENGYYKITLTRAPPSQQLSPLGNSINVLSQFGARQLWSVEPVLHSEDGISLNTSLFVQEKDSC